MKISSFFLLFGLLNTISGSTVITVNFSSTCVVTNKSSSSIYLSIGTVTAANAITSLTTLTNESIQENGSTSFNIPTMQPRSFWAWTKTHNTSSNYSSNWSSSTIVTSRMSTATSKVMKTTSNSTSSSLYTRAVQPAPNSKNLPTATTSTLSATFSTKIIAPISSSVAKTTSQSTRIVTKSSANIILPTPTPTTKKTADEVYVKILGWHVKSDTLVLLFYIMTGVTLLCIILLVVNCCCWRKQRKTMKKLQRESTTLSNPYANNHQVVGFPSPLQLSTFTVGESPYDMPENVETRSEDLAYVSVVDGNESEAHYAAVGKDGTTSSIADSESRDEEPPLSPDYTNAPGSEYTNTPHYTNESDFQDPYQQLMPTDVVKENPYTSLINRDKKEDSDVSV